MLYNEVQYVGIWFNALFLDGRYPNLKPVKTSVEQMLNIAIFAKIIMKLLTISLQANSNKLRLVIMLGREMQLISSASRSSSSATSMTFSQIGLCHLENHRRTARRHTCSS